MVVEVVPGSSAAAEQQHEREQRIAGPRIAVRPALALSRAGRPAPPTGCAGPLTARDRRMSFAHDPGVRAEPPQQLGAVEEAPVSLPSCALAPPTLSPGSRTSVTGTSTAPATITISASPRRDALAASRRARRAPRRAPTTCWRRQARSGRPTISPPPWPPARRRPRRARRRARPRDDRLSSAISTTGLKKHSSSGLSRLAQPMPPGRRGCAESQAQKAAAAATQGSARREVRPAPAPPPKRGRSGQRSPQDERAEVGGEQRDELPQVACRERVVGGPRLAEKSLAFTVQPGTLRDRRASAGTERPSRAQRGPRDDRAIRAHTIDPGDDSVRTGFRVPGTDTSALGSARRRCAPAPGAVTDPQCSYARYDCRRCAARRPRPSSRST